MSNNNVFDIFSGQSYSHSQQRKIIRLSPEIDGLCLLHSFQAQDEQFTVIPILCWGLQHDGEVVAMIPWKQSLRACTDFDNDDSGYFHGYYDAALDDIFDEAPLHKALELEASANFFEEHQLNTKSDVLQEIPDHIGTHALLVGEEESSLVLTEVLSWQLRRDGEIYGMLINHDKVENTPVLIGDECLYSATENPSFRFYFQHHVANQIKNRDPEVLADIARLLSES